LAPSKTRSVANSATSPVGAGSDPQLAAPASRQRGAITSVTLPTPSWSKLVTSSAAVMLAVSSARCGPGLPLLRHKQPLGSFNHPAARTTPTCVQVRAKLGPHLRFHGLTKASVYEQRHSQQIVY